MEEVYLQMKKYEIKSQARINLKESFMKVKNFLEDGSFGLKDRITDVPSTSSSIEEQNSPKASDLYSSLLETSGEVPLYNLTLLMENPKARLKPNIPQEAIDKLKTLQCIKEKIKIHKAPNVPNVGRQNKDYNYLEEPVYDPKKADLRSGEEFVMRVQVFLPFHYKQNTYKPQYRSKCQNEILILSSQTLLDLREVIVCMDDYRSSDGDVSENPLDPSGCTYKDLYPSSMFFIDDTFYVDYSKPTDYSVVVKEWAQSLNIPLNHQTKDMSKTCIRDLSLKLNYPYVFQHLGDCEHLIHFVGASIMSGRISLCSSDYPRFTKLYKVQGNMCMMCNKCYPTWIVIGYSRLPNEFSYLCKICFKNYCYIGNEKIGSFKAYHFFDRRAYTDS